MFQILPVICGDSKMQPVYVGDVASAIVNSLGNEGKTYEIGGPTVYSMRELMELVNKATEQNVPLIPVPTWLAYYKAFFLGMLPNPMVTIDQVRLLEQDNVASGNDLASLGVTGTPVEAIIPNYLMHYKPSGQFRTAT